MFNEIIIGEKTWSSYSSAKIFKDTLDDVWISQNRTFYNVEMSFGDQRIIIVKETEEGKRITEYLDDPELKEQDLQNYIDEVGLKHMKPESLKAFIKQIEENSFKAGKRAAKKEIQRVLFAEEH